MSLKKTVGRVAATLVVPVLVAWGLCGCSTTTGPSGTDTESDVPDTVPDAVMVLPDGAVVPPDTGFPEVRCPGDGGCPAEAWAGELPVGPDLPREGGKLGDACTANGECLSGFCVPSDIGYICTDVCIDDCPEGWDCKGVAFSDPDTLFVCLPDMETTCARTGVCVAGEVASETCGKCGKRDRTCKENCQWGEWSNCFGEGTCTAGDSESEGCGNCGSRARTCSEACLWNEWEECQGEGICTEGVVENQGCGNCGSQTRTCTAKCDWSEWGSCQGSGICEPGASESTACGSCGTTLRLCTDACQWSDWAECANEGVCTPGAKESVVCGKCGNQTRSCTDLCEWSQWGSCEGQGQCLPDETEYEDCGKCGKRGRTCTGQCAWGAWGQCQDEGVCSPGDKQTEACGKCGTRERTCTDQCGWSPWGACTGEGVCSPNQMESTACGNCGTKYRFCSDQCTWGPFGSCSGEGDCPPGTTKPCNNCGTQTCSAGCAWSSCVLGKMDGYEENDSEGQSYALPGITDAAGDTQTVTASINPAYDPDWFKIHIDDTSLHSIDPKFTLSVPSGQTYKLCITYKCDSGKTFSACQNISGANAISVGVGDCESIWQGDDDSGTAFIQVNPISSGSCSDYTLKVEA